MGAERPPRIALSNAIGLLQHDHVKRRQREQHDTRSGCANLVVAAYKWAFELTLHEAWLSAPSRTLKTDHANTHDGGPEGSLWRERLNAVSAQRHTS
jgi:hypothetical protein